MHFLLEQAAWSYRSPDYHTPLPVDRGEGDPMRMPLAASMELRELENSPVAWLGLLAISHILRQAAGPRGRAIAVTSPLHSGQGACRLPRI